MRLNEAENSIILIKKWGFLALRWANNGENKPDLTRPQVLVSYKDLRRITKLELNEYIRRIIRPWDPLGVKLVSFYHLFQS